MSFKKNKPFIVWLLCLLLLPGFTWSDRHPELANFLEKQRTSSPSANSYRNSSTVLEKGNRVEVLEFKKLPTGVFGIHIKIVGGPRANQDFWVEHKDENSALSLYESSPDSWKVGGTARRTYDVNKARGGFLNKNIEAIFQEQITHKAANKKVSIPGGVSQTFKSEDESTQDLIEPVPIIEHALDKIEATNALHKLLGSMDNIGNRNCSTCEENFRNMRYMQCNSRNDYLEKEIATAAEKPGLLGDVLRTPIRSSIIKPACIQMGMNMKFGKGSKSFRECDDKGFRTAFRPCISNNYFKLLNNSFQLVSMCMKEFIAPHLSDKEQKLDVRAVFALINIESGFHVNAMSGSGAGGIGQFTQSAINDVNSNQLNDIRSTLNKHPNQQCRKMSQEMLSSATPMRPGRNSCDRISIENGNPIKNMIYTYAYLSDAKKNVNSQIFENRYYKHKFNLPRNELNKIRRALMVWSHNTGPAGTWTPAKALLNTFYRNKSVTNANLFISQMQQYMQKFPATANKSRARRRETSRYFPSVTKTLNDIERAVGGDSCVNF